VKPYNQARRYTLLLGICLTNAHTAIADSPVVDVQLMAKPASCVALHKGQKCFQKIVFSWTSKAKSHTCLFSDATGERLFCSTEPDARFVYQYASTASLTFSLRSESDDRTLATTTIRNAWVYRTGKRSSSGWRLF